MECPTFIVATFRVCRPSLFLPACLLFAAGCRHWEDAVFNQGLGVGEDAVLIVPFAEPRERLWYGESDNGRYVAEVVVTWARQNLFSPNFPEEEAAAPVLHAIRDTTDKKITIARWKSLTTTLGVRYVVYGEIQDIGLTKPENVGFLQPHVVAQYRVIDVMRSRTVYESPPIALDAHTDLSKQMPDWSLNEDPKKARSSILIRLGSKIGQDLYGYYRE